MTGRKALILIEELEQGGLRAQQMERPAAERIVLKAVGEEMYSERLPGKLGLINRIGKRLTEIFKP